MGCEAIIEMFFHMSTNIKLYHWQTKSFARHKATDELLLVIQPLIDTFIETYMGRYGRPQFNGSFSFDIEELNETTSNQLIKYYITFLKKEVPKYLQESDSDLMNIRDSILGELNKTLYLFTFS